MLDYVTVSSIKRNFSRSKRAKALKDKHILKGVKGVKGGKMVMCESCGSHIPYYKSQLDHIDPITPVMISQKVMSFIMLLERVFCDDNNLQVICPECHKKKNNRERGQRVKWRKRKKFLVIRRSSGVRIRVLPIIDLKKFPEGWETLAVFQRRKQADAEMKRRKKL